MVFMSIDAFSEIFSFLFENVVCAEGEAVVFVVDKGGPVV